MENHDNFNRHGNKTWLMKLSLNIFPLLTLCHRNNTGYIILSSSNIFSNACVASCVLV